MSLRSLLAAAALIGTLALSACAGTAGGPASPAAASPPAGAPSAIPVDAVLPSPARTTDHGAWDGEVVQPPPFEVRYGEEALLVHATTFCGASSSGCVDGFDPRPPSIGSPAEIFVHVPIDDFDELVVSQLTDEDPCVGHSMDAEVEALDDGWWRVTPRGPADEYRVSLFAAGGQGDMIADLVWTTPDDQPLPEPEALVSLITEHDGEPDSYGLDLSVANLPTTPTRASATVVVTAANGASRTIEATRDETCAGEGVVRFTAPEAEAKAAAALGGFPFTTEVELHLDGVVHRAAAIFPDDEIPDEEPYLALDFSPALPSGAAE